MGQILAVSSGPQRNKPRWRKSQKFGCIYAWIRVYFHGRSCWTWAVFPASECACERLFCNIRNMVRDYR
jgi:hypothetical protein